MCSQWHENMLIIDQIIRSNAKSISDPVRVSFTDAYMDYILLMSFDKLHVVKMKWYSVWAFSRLKKLHWRVAAGGDIAKIFLKKYLLLNWLRQIDAYMRQ